MRRALTSFALFSGVLTLASQAFAQAAPAQPNPMMSTLIPVVFMLAVMYFLVMRPQMKKQKELQAYLSKLQRGDDVITTAGMLGRIEGLTDTHVTLEIAPSVRVKMLRSAIAGSAKVVATPSASSTEVKQ